MAKDYDKIAKSLGAVNYDSLATSVEGGAATQAQTIGARGAKEVGSQLRQRIGATLPWVGGLVGGVVGGVPGATLGGMTGQLGSQALTGSLPTSPKEAIDTIGGAGALQGLMQAAPEQLLAASNLGMRLALKATPEVAQTAIREGITVTKGGLQKLMARITGASKAEQAIVRGAASQGLGHVPAQDIADQAFAKAHMELQGAPAGEIDKLADLRDEFVRREPQILHPSKQLAQRKYYDRQTKAFRDAVPQGKTPPLNAQDVWNRSMGDVVRQSLRDNIPEIGHPEVYAKITGKASTPEDLQKLKALVYPAVRRSGPVSNRIAQAAARPAAGAVLGGLAGAASSPTNRVGHGVEGAIAGGLLTHPAVMSQLALLAANPQLQPLLQILPRLIGAGASQP